MTRLDRSGIWRNAQKRVRLIWKLAILVLVVGAVANPLVLLLDATDIPVLESSLKNACIMASIILALWLICRLDGRSLAAFGIGFWPEPRNGLPWEC